MRRRAGGGRAGVKDLAGAVVVITGASSGMGRATARAFADRGADLVLAARGLEGLESVAAECTDRGVQVIAVPTDIRDAAQVKALADAAVLGFGRIDVWVEAAAVLAAGRLEDHPEEEIQQLVATNVAGSALGARAAMQVFEEQQRGVLIMVSSMLGILPNPLVPVYVMSKFAMRGLALSLRQAVIDRPGIAICTVLPGPVDTPMFARAANRTGRQLRAIPPAIAPERVAATIVSCARRPRRQATAGLVSHAILAVHHLAPRLVEYVVAQYSARLLTRKAQAEASGGVLAEPEGGRGAVHGGYRVGALRRHLGERLGRG